MQQQSEINGIVDAVIFRNDENGYGVVRVELDNGDQTVAVGCLPYISPGESISAEGSWSTHARHGRQFRIEQCSRLLPSSAEAIYEYLAGGTVRGVGPATAAMLVDKFGDRTLDILEMHPDKLASVKGISAAKAKEISSAFRRQAGVRRLTELLCSYGIQPVYALRMYKYYGDAAADVLHKNPYILASSHIGASFAEADAFALALGVEGDSINRVCAATLFELNHNAGNGHCFIPRDKLADATSRLIGVTPELALEAADKLSQSGEIICDDVAGLHACYLASLYAAESETAARIKAMLGKKCGADIDTDRLIARLEAANGIKYAPRQREAIALAAENRMLVITGGPGTGKTTILRAVLAMYEELGLKTCLAAPTGRAAKRMGELCGAEASTVHRLLGAKMSEDGENVVFTRNASDKLSCGALILDECSMVDITLMHALLDALEPDCRMLLVGDADQLPSVGPGCVFSDIIRSGIVPVVRLTEIFRQKDGSRIVGNAHMINRGEHPDFSDNSGDFFRLRRMSGASLVDTVVELCGKRLPENMHIPSSQIQILSPTRKGEAGTAALNSRLQEALNPPAEGKKEKPFGSIVFRVGDRVIQTKNNYDIIWKNGNITSSGVYNGDIGVITDIDGSAEHVTVDFEDKTAYYGFELLNELEHAWALTVHKAQGSEYRAVILALSGASPLLLTRGVLYTAVTRAKELMIMVGDDNIAHRMIDNHRQSRRYSALRIRLADENT